MREIRIDGKDLAADDPIRDIIEQILLIRDRKMFVSPLEIFFERGIPTKGRETKSLRFGKKA
jgi:hypothetical protein